MAKHANSGTATVSLRHHPDDLEVVVEDTGHGFDSEEMASREGFGLTSVREQIGRLGGAVEVTSARNGGTRVSVRVPSRPQTDA